MGHPLGFAPEAALEDLGLPQGGPGAEVVAAAWVTRVLAAPVSVGSLFFGSSLPVLLIPMNKTCIQRQAISTCYCLSLPASELDEIK